VSKVLTHRQEWRRKLVGTAATLGVIVAAGLGMAMPANADTIGHATVYTPSWAFKSKNPSKEEVRRTAWQSAWNTCRNDNKNTRSVEMTGYTKNGSGDGFTVVSKWNCRNTP